LAPARIIQAEDTARREEAAAKMGFSAYGITANDDPLSQAMKGLIDNASGHEHQIALLCQAIEKLSAQRRGEDCVPLGCAAEGELRGGEADAAGGEISFLVRGGAGQAKPRLHQPRDDVATPKRRK
jgi:hypothetical protein